MSKQRTTNPFYLFDLIAKLFKSKNIPAILYLILNIAIVSLIFYELSSKSPVAILYGIVVYLIAAVIAISPIGEWILRLTQGCSKLKTDDPKQLAILNRLEPLFVEVLDRAHTKQVDYSISDNINLYIKEDEDANAFALGRNTICVTTGLLKHSNEEIKAILGHEVGHLASHDTDLVLLITVGNFIVTAIVTIFKFVILLYKLILSIATLFAGGSEGLLGRIITGIASFLTLIAVDLVMYLWTQLGILMVMKTSRNAEYAADAFSCDLGYTDGLLSFLEKLPDSEDISIGERSLKERTQVFAALSDSHPATYKRIAKIEEHMGVLEND